jgi:hypothetical protein
VDKHLKIALVLSAVDKASSVISKTVAKSSKEMERLGRSSRIAEQMDSIGNRALIAGTAVTGFFASTLGAASSLEESLSKTRVVFGENSEAVIRWAENSAQAFGQSQQDALEAASTYGNLFQAFGVGRQRAQEMSMTLTQLAADLASFNNTTVEEAVIALRSGLSGETEPLKRFGVAINDVRLKDQALKMGLISTTKGALEPGIKAQAAFALIMHDSALAQGDFARTSDGFANSQRIARAELANVTAQIGSALIPAVTELLKSVAPVIKAFAQWAKDNPTLVKVIAAIGVVLLGLGVALKVATAATWLFNAALWANPITWIIAAIIALIAAIAALVIYWDEITAWMKANTPQWLQDWIQWQIDAIVYLIEVLSWAWDGISEFFSNFSQVQSALYSAVGDAFSSAWDAIVSAWDSMLAYLNGLWDRFYEAGANIVNSIVDGIKAQAASAVKAVEDMVGKMRAYLPFSPAKVGPLKDIHRVKIVETIAGSMKPSVLTNKMQQVMGATRQVMNSPLAPASPTAQLSPVMAGGGGSSFNYAPQITITGADSQSATNFREILNQHKDEIIRILRAENARSERTAMR